jgi:hypothetical protein
LILTFAFFSLIVFEPRNTHGDITVIDFQTDQTDSMLNSLDANSAGSPQATPATETANFNLGLDDYTEETDEIEESDPLASLENLHELQLHVPTITNSPRCVPARSGETFGQASNPKKPTTPRRMRTVRVDAWAVPASANWSRTRTMVRKANRGTRSSEWALPF